MQKRFFGLLITIAIILNILNSCSSGKNVDQTKDKASEELIVSDDLNAEIKGKDEFVLVSENDFLKLFVNGKTAEISVFDKRSNQIFYSNPKDRNDDAYAEGSNKTKLNSQFSIEYFNPTDKIGSLDSFNDSVAIDQIQFSKIENGFRITYTLGKIKKTFLFPSVITKERFENLILSKLDETDKRYLLLRYRMFSLKEIPDVTKGDYIKKYPTLNKSDLYCLDTDIMDTTKEKIEKIIAKTGYSQKNLEEDNNANQVLEEEKSLTVQIPLEYYLDKDNLITNIPVSKLKYTSNYKILTISLLPFFGAAGKDKNGYILVPDGSGALINLNNQKTQFSPYSQRVYGRDRSIPINTEPEMEQKVSLPVFGMKTEENAFLAVIEKGAAISKINADISGRDNSYNSVYSAFILNEYIQESVSFADKYTMNMYSTNIYDDDIRIRFAFLNKDSASYSGMAKYYQNYLLENKKLKINEFKDDIPLYLDLLGAVDYRTSFFGFPVERLKGLTTFNEAKTILDELKNNDIKNVVVRYLYWSNGGVRNNNIDSLNIVEELSKGLNFKDFYKNVVKGGVEVFPDFEMQYVKNAVISGSSDKIAQTISGELAKNLKYNTATLLKNDSDYIIKPLSYIDILNKVIKSYQKLSVNSVSFSKMASELSSDYNKNTFTNREKAKSIIENVYSKANENGYKVLSDDANDYAIAYSSHLMNIPNQSSGFYIEDEHIPFYQIVVHGYIPYSSTPINFSKDMTDEMLKHIEYGINPSFKWIYKENYELKETEYSFYALNYRSWLKDCVDFYKKLNEIFSELQGFKIMGHQKITENVYRTDYENKASVYVNYNTLSVSAEGIEIEAKGYKIIKR